MLATIIDFLKSREFYLWVALPSITFIVALIFTRNLIFLAPKLGYSDLPAANKLHTTKTPLLGGCAIFGSMLLALIANNKYIPLANIGFICATTLPAFLLGLYDDKRPIAPYPKLFLFIIISVLPLFFIKLAWPELIFLAAAIFWLTNSLNLLDNSDGHCTSIAIAIFTASCIIAPEPIKICLVGSLLGFLIFNRPKASIFLGDAGSLLIGSICVIATFLSFETSNTFSLRALPILCVPIYDTLSVIFIRIYARRSIMIGGTDHTSHRLISSGLALSSINISLAIFTIIVAISAYYVNAPVLELILALACIWLLENYFRKKTKK